MLGSSFDEAGALISQSADAAGNVTKRDYDNQGNILYTSFDSNGNQTGQNSIAIGPALNNLNRLSQTPAAQSDGIASPFAQTS